MCGPEIIALPKDIGEPRSRREEHARDVAWLPGWHKTRALPLRICYPLTRTYKNFLFENPPYCPLLQGETIGREGLRGVQNRVDLGARTWYRPALWPPQDSGSTKTPSSRSSAITGRPSRSTSRGTRTVMCSKRSQGVKFITH